MAEVMMKSMMNMWRTLAFCAGWCAALAGCGGGGGGSGGAPAEPVDPPASGSYAWVLKATGPTDAVKYGLSLVHRSTPEVEWVIEPASAAVTDARTIARGTVDAAGQRVDALVPYALIYIVGGDVRRVALTADGTAPREQVQRARSTSACRFVVDAIDHGTPEASRFIVSTAGADGDCGSADDARAEVRLDTALGLVFTPLVDGPLAALRDPLTLTPRGWLTSTQGEVWATGDLIAVRDAGNPLGRVLASTLQGALVESAAGLSVLEFSGDTAVLETPLAGVSGSGWRAIGHDADHFYVYRNSNGTTSAQWTLLRISRALPQATILGSGSGQLRAVAMGAAQLYATLLGPAQNSLLRISKAVPGLTQVVESGPTDTVATVVAGAAGVHLLSRVSQPDTASARWEIELIDEIGRQLYASTAGGFPLVTLDETAIDFRVSDSRSSFLFADGYGVRALSGASLVVYDGRTRSATTLGALPGAAEFGNAFVFAGAAGGPTTLGGGFVVRSVDGTLQSEGAKLFSFESGTAGSLQFTNTTQ